MIVSSHLLFEARLPLPPGVNRSYRIVHIRDGDGREYNTLAATSELAQFKEDAAWTLYGVSPLNFDVLTRVQCGRPKTPLSIEIDFYFSSLWRRDIDGGEKAVIDAVFTRLDLNDNLITEKHTRKLVSRDDPHVDVRLFLLS